MNEKFNKFDFSITNFLIYKSMKDLFDRVYNDKGPIGNWATRSEGYYVFPKLEGPISNHMIFNGKEIITWSINDYLGLANHPDVKKADADATKEYDIDHLFDVIHFNSYKTFLGNLVF